MASRGLGEVCARNTARMAERLAEIPGCGISFQGPHFKEIVLDTPVPGSDLVRGLATRGFLVGPALARWFPDAGELRSAERDRATQCRRPRATGRVDRKGAGREMNGPLESSAGTRTPEFPLVFELSRPERRSWSLPEPMDGAPELASAIGPDHAAEGRSSPARGLRARSGAALHTPFATELGYRRGRLPTGLLHDEVQPQDRRGGRGPTRLRHAPSTCRRRPRPGCPRAARHPREGAVRRDRHGQV